MCIEIEIEISQFHNHVLLDDLILERISHVLWLVGLKEGSHEVSEHDGEFIWMLCFW